MKCVQQTRSWSTALGGIATAVAVRLCLKTRSSIILGMTISIVAVVKLCPRIDEIVSSAIGSSHACSLCSHLLPWAAT